MKTRSLIGSTVISLLLLACGLQQDDPAHAGSQPPSDGEASDAKEAIAHVGSRTNSEVLLFRPLMPSRNRSSINEVFVSSSDSLSIKMVTRSDGTTLRVADPSGVDVGATPAPGVRVDEATKGGEHLSLWTIEKPKPGRWTLEVVAPSGLAFGLLTVTEYGGPTLEITREHSVAPRGTQSIEVEVGMGSDAVLGAAVSATVVGPNGYRSELQLLDDGRSPDRLPGDGVYSGADVVGSDEGQYFVDVWATATLPDGRRVNRTAENQFEVTTFADVTFAEPGVVIKPIRTDGTFPIEVTLTNLGNGPAEGVTVRFYDNAGGWPIGWTAVENLQPNETRALNHGIQRRSYHADSVSVCVRLHVTGAYLEPVIENNERCASLSF